MNYIQIQDKSIYKLLLPVFESQGYEPLPAKNQFRKRTAKGFRSVIFSVSGATNEQLLDIHFGVRFDIIENLVHQFLSEPRFLEKESNTIIASLPQLKHAPIGQFFIPDKISLERACDEIAIFMQEKGFRFLDACDSLRRIDAKINRKPHQPCLYMASHIHRCFKGIIIARLLQRNDFETLITIYKNHLCSRRASSRTIENFNRLVTYLKCFSFN